MLFHAALERLSYTYLLTMGHMTVSDYDKLKRTCERFQVFFNFLKIPVDIPKELVELSDYSQNFTSSKKNAPSIMTRIRNEFVHPKQRERFNPEVIFELWRLYAWYVEMSILAILGYSGDVYDRITETIRKIHVKV